jgi:tetratricopeptide (TPR) repeat protein
VIQSATAAYRADLAATAKPFGPHDDSWITIATLLSQAGAVSEEQRGALVSAATELARAILTEVAAAQPSRSEWGSPDVGTCETVLILAEQMFEAGALHLTRVLLNAFLEADTSLTILQRGRLVSRRARADARLGHVEEAMDQYRAVARLGKQIDSAELRIRAWIGYAALAYMRGNYPEQMRYSRRAARLANRFGLPFLNRMAHIGLMITAGAQHRFDDALWHARIIYRESLGDPILEGEILGNIGQLLLEAGHTRQAADVFAGLLRRPLPLRLILPVLGGLAVAAGKRGDVAAVRWVLAELERLDATTGILPYIYASALLECASALSMVNRRADAERLLDVAVGVADAGSYNEIIVKADELRHARPVTPSVERNPTPNVERLVSELETGNTESLPRHILVMSSTA